MADDASEQPKQRSAADKERSRQLSRPVSAREAARGRAAQSAGKGQRATGQQAQRGRTQGAPGRSAGRGRESAQRPQARRPQAGRRTGRSRTALFTWMAVALVVVVVVVLVVVYTTSSSKKSTVFTPKPVSAKVLSEITNVPASVYNKVGEGIVSDLHLPAVETGQPALEYTGKPGMLGLLGEFCPYCAAERWAIITSFSRFGTFTGLQTMQSSTTDIDPATQTFTFATSTYTSKYFAAKLVEFYGQDKPTGAQTRLQNLTSKEAETVSKYDHAPTSTSSGDSIPFMDFGNKVIFWEVSYTPHVLATLSRTTIAAGLKNPNNPVTKLIIGSSNNISAAVCSIDGGKPGSVCQSPGVQAAAKVLKLKF